MLNKYCTLIGCVLIITFSFSCTIFKHKKKLVLLPGTWQTQPIVIDGDSKDWPSPYPNYDSKARVAYATSNDENNLYISMETGDELTLMKILKLGMVVSIDTGGKKSPQFTINFPLQNENEIFEMQKAEEHPRKEERYTQKSKQLMQKIKKGAVEATQYSLEGFKNSSGGYLVSQVAPCGIKVKLGIDEFNELVWEAVVPLKILYNMDSITKAYAGKPISVCFAIKGYKKPDSRGSDPAPAAQNMNSGMGGRGGSNSMRGSSGGGGRPQQENPNQHLYENTKTWKQFGLATRP